MWRVMVVNPPPDSIIADYIEGKMSVTCATNIKKMRNNSERELAPTFVPATGYENSLVAERPEHVQ